MRRRRRSTCAPARAALARLRVANGVKRGRGREEVEAPERRKRCRSVPRSLQSVGGGGCRRQAQRGELPRVPAQLEVAGAEPGRERPLDAQDPRTARRARSARSRGHADGPGGRPAGARRARGPGAPSALRSLTPGKGQGAVNQRGRERPGAG
ncbi:unnamed protein product [Pipistrellus nathusii]|uniref:Uncharacterized protein n=1 Tax=Pipistrellus nathusii TaxID=59473 RepID=A0ABP0A7M6_PIPNA